MTNEDAEKLLLKQIVAITDVSYYGPKDECDVAIHFFSNGKQYRADLTRLEEW